MPPVVTVALPGASVAESLPGTRPVTAPPEQDAAGVAGFVSADRPAPGRGAQTDAAAGRGGAAPGLPGDLPGRGGQPESGVTRRRALFSVVGVAAAAGLAAAGWELTRGGGSHPAAGPAPKKASTPAARARLDGVPRGGRIWSFATGQWVQSGIAVAHGAVYGGCTGLPAFALRASDGGRIWGTGPGNAPKGVVVAGDVLYLGSTASGVFALRTANGDPIWHADTNGPVVSGIALGPGAVYAGSYDGNVYGLRIGDGHKLWSFPAGSPVNSGIAAADGVVCAGTDHGYVYGLSASHGDRLWAFPVGGRMGSGIVMANGVVYFGGWDNKVHALRASTGHKIWEYTTGGIVQSGIVVAGGVVYVGSDDHKIYALRA